jgi:myosin heavy subunit
MMYLKGVVAMQYPKRLWIAAYSLVLLAITLMPASALPAGHENQPFWTEKSAFVEGDDLFVVGVATKARSFEEGRMQAFEQGKIELMNYAQITSLEAQGLVIETQMTYEEPSPDGTVTVYRLLRVPAAKLVAIQGRLNEQARAKEQSLEKTRQELSALQRSLIEKQNALEGHQTSLQEKSQRIQVQQRQLEGLLKQLAIKIPESTTSTTNGSQKTDSLMQQLKQAEAQLDAQEQLLREISARAQRRINQEYEGYRKKCEYLMIGMTEEEVRAVMGDPQTVKERIDDRYRDPHVGHFWYYRGRSYGLTLSLGKTGILQEKSLLLPTDMSLNRCSILPGH